MNGLNYISVMLSYYKRPILLKKNELKYNAGWQGNIFHSFSDSSHSKGVSILFRKNLIVEILIV